MDGMHESGSAPLTEWLRHWQQDGGSARLDSRLMQAIYGELRRIAAQRLARELKAPLTPTELVHETWLRMKPGDAPISDRNAFLRLASVAMRNLLVDQARERMASKRHAVRQAITVSLLADESPSVMADTRLLDLDRAMDALASDHPRAAEAVGLRAFAGLDLVELASALDVSLATAKRDLAFGRAWLAQALSERDA